MCALASVSVPASFPLSVIWTCQEAHPDGQADRSMVRGRVMFFRAVDDRYCQRHLERVRDFSPHPHVQDRKATKSAQAPFGALTNTANKLGQRPRE